MNPIFWYRYEMRLGSDTTEEEILDVFPILGRYPIKNVFMPV
jgi:hypothetical protein